MLYCFLLKDIYCFLFGFRAFIEKLDQKGSTIVFHHFFTRMVLELKHYFDIAVLFNCFEELEEL